MRVNLFLFLCFTGVIPVVRSTLSTGHHKYHLIKLSYTWPMAQNYCRVMYTDLATIITDDDWLQLNKEATSQGYTGNTWTGLYDDSDNWRWSLNDVPLNTVTYTNWLTGEPNNHSGKESCVVMIVLGSWGDFPCNSLKSFICYDANFSGSSKFIGVSTPLSWPDAQIYCRTHHTDLASSLNSPENSLILEQVLKLQLESWIGLYRDTWKWSDGTIATNIPWFSGQPDNFYKNENCALHLQRSFSDFYCSSNTYFYCHSIRRKQQRMKLQVMSDGSVFDPAVQSYILEQIKNKLEEKRLLENSTVIWKVQPDGNIFHKKNKGYL